MVDFFAFPSTNSVDGGRMSVQPVSPATAGGNRDLWKSHERQDGILGRVCNEVAEHGGKFITPYVLSVERGGPQHTEGERQ